MLRRTMIAIHLKSSDPTDMYFWQQHLERGDYDHCGDDGDQYFFPL